ncbi:MAG TPA: hypothetical protein VGI12_11380 [Vicinamibacterales bacterium]|jgi:hypothetical protein
MGRAVKSRLKWVGTALIGAYVLFLAAMFVVMSQPPERFGAIMRHFPMPAMMIVPFETLWNVARGGTLQLGDQAPDFTLPTADKASAMHLASFRGRIPVVLVFGSYT